MDGRPGCSRHPSEHLRSPRVTEGSKMKTITLTLFVLMLSNVAKAQNPDPSKGVLDTAVSAKTVGVSAIVEWSKTSEVLNSQAELDRILCRS